MPSSTRPTRIESWPPCQVRLTPTIADDDISPCEIEEDPLSYFLTPTPPLDEDGDEVMMDFDAGIEDSNHPRDIIRSISPSNLDGLRRPKARSESPDLDSEVETPDEDDDEDYIRFMPNSMGLPYNLNDFTIDGVKSKLAGHHKLTASFPAARPSSGIKTDALLSPSSFHVPGSAQGRVPLPIHGRGRPRSLSLRKHPQRLWREPSPDVWSIEEETEEEMRSEAGSSVVGDNALLQNNKKLALDGTAAKPIKRVRFVLPDAA